MSSRSSIVASQPRSKTGESLELKWASGGTSGGLDILENLDYLRVQQTIATLGAGCDKNNQYVIANKQDQKIFYANENTSCCSRFWCGPARRFDMSLQNEGGQDLLQFIRPVRCDACCCPCCLMKIMIQTPEAEVLGYVRQKWSMCGVEMHVTNSKKELEMAISGPCCPFRCMTDLDFMISNKEGEEIGLIQKFWGGKKNYINMDHENFLLKFPLSLEIKNKALLLGASFLINYMYFEMT